MGAEAAQARPGLAGLSAEGGVTDELTPEQRAAWDSLPPRGDLADEGLFRAAAIDFRQFCNLAGLDPPPTDEAIRAHVRSPD